jgi:hypothetical protein
VKKASKSAVQYRSYFPYKITALTTLKRLGVGVGGAMTAVAGMLGVGPVSRPTLGLPNKRGTGTVTIPPLGWRGEDRIPDDGSRLGAPEQRAP